jgi:hypothetical protein
MLTCQVFKILILKDFYKRIEWSEMVIDNNCHLFRPIAPFGVITEHGDPSAIGAQSKLQGVGVEIVLLEEIRLIIYGG